LNPVRSELDRREVLCGNSLLQNAKVDGGIQVYEHFDEGMAILSSAGHPGQAREQAIRIRCSRVRD
jgi:hypothetical protein